MSLCSAGPGRQGAGRFGRGFVFGTAPLCSLHGASSVSRFLPRMNVGEGFPKLFWRRRMLLRDDRQHKPRLFLAAAARARAARAAALAACCCARSAASARAAALACCSSRSLLSAALRSMQSMELLGLLVLFFLSQTAFVSTLFDKQRKRRSREGQEKEQRRSREGAGKDKRRSREGQEKTQRRSREGAETEQRRSRASVGFCGPSSLWAFVHHIMKLEAGKR